MISPLSLSSVVLAVQSSPGWSLFKRVCIYKAAIWSDTLISFEWMLLFPHFFLFHVWFRILLETFVISCILDFMYIIMGTSVMLSVIIIYPAIQLSQ